MIKNILAMALTAFILAGISIPVNKSELNADIYDGKRFIVENDNIYCSNSMGTLITYNTKTARYVPLMSDLSLTDMNDKYIIGYDHDHRLTLVNRINNITKTIDIKAKKVIILDNYIYYIDSDSLYLCSYNILTGNETVIINRQIDNGMAANSEYLFYSLKENNSATTGSKIYRYNLKTGQTELFYNGRYCYYYKVFNDALYLFDYEEHRLISVDLFDRHKKLYPIVSLNFYVSGNDVYYQPFLEEIQQGANTINIYTNNKMEYIILDDR